MFKPRPKQQEVLAYQGGKMGVSAVPGSGKTATLSYLAAHLVAQADLAEGQEVLVVTLTKSAVGNFAQSLARYLKDEFKMLPNLGYRVRTLHSLANDIVRERPSLVSLADNFIVIDEREADDILNDAAEVWLRSHSELAGQYVMEQHQANPRTQEKHYPDLIKNIARVFIRQAKDMQLSELDIQQHLSQSPQTLPLLEMGLQIYAQYERSLRYRGAVDFQDLIRLALRILRLDAQYLARLQMRFPYILEDEAQDSSQLQEAILRTLAGQSGNWVRVGDPNQAIYETFTTANPQYLRDFLRESDVQAKTLPNSGRNTASIIQLANQLIRWSWGHPNAEVRAKRPLDEPFIELTPSDDPQGNPDDDPSAVFLYGKQLSSKEERDIVLQSIQHWLPANPDKTAAILLPLNSSGAEMAKSLREAGIPYVENLKSSTGTRAVIGSLGLILSYLSMPLDSSRLAKVYEVLRRDERADESRQQEIAGIMALLRKIKYVEDFLWPRGQDWLADSVSATEQNALYEHLADFRQRVRRWLEALSLPIEQQILLISHDMFVLESEIATAYSAAHYLGRFAEMHPSAHLAEFTEELLAIARGQRSFSGAGDGDESFNPESYKGKVTVTTMHKAKGLEWDRVYLMSVSNYDFPSGDDFDSFISEKWFIRNQLNLEAESLAQLKALMSQMPYVEGQATLQARSDYVAERLRLLYVGITRARRELIITWNTGSKGQQIEARPLAALRGWWEAQRGRA